ncbi:MAG: unknown protein [Tomato bushy stunt virus satellite RNA C]|nr:MAG: unknown protein [Tomato bushy stunt virus satellite RNA C]
MMRSYLAIVVLSSTYGVPVVYGRTANHRCQPNL